MNPRRTTLTAALSTAAAAAVCAALAGCSTQADATTTTSVTPTGTATSGGTSATPSTSTSTTVDPAATEAKDRQDAEAVWHKFDTLGTTMQSLPADQVTRALTAVSVDPALGRMQAQNAQFRAEGKVGYGTDISYISWPKPINGGDTALLEDCADQSQSGYMDAKTGDKLTVGTPNTPIQVKLTRTPQGWKVADASLVIGGTCTPGKAW